jgi:hypothetical protein
MSDEPRNSQEPDPEPDPVIGDHQDSFRRVYFGQVSEPLVRPHPAPPEAEEDDLTRAALGDPEAGRERAHDEPTAWRMVAIALLAAAALAIVFGRR